MQYDIPEITCQERKKYEAAEALGLTEKLLRVGWGSLTARETGLVGALTAGKKVTLPGEETVQAERPPSV